jgi:hypothetical protein
MISFRVVIDKLKKNYILKKFKKIISATNIFNDLNDLGNYNDMFCSENELINIKFDMISNFIMKKYVIDDINIILRAYYRWNKNDPNLAVIINSRKLLCAWLIYYCPNIILGDINTDDKNNLIVLSQKIIIELTKLSNNKLQDNYDITNFNKIFLSYSNNITLFLEKDKIDKINYYTAEWISLHKSYESIDKSNRYESEQKQFILNNIIKDKELIKKYLDKLVTNFDYNRLKLIINLSNDISKKTIENYKKIIEQDIIDRKFEINIKLLNDIKQFIKIFNRKDNISEIDEKINPEYFIHLIQNNVLNINDIKTFGDYLINKICAIGSKSNEEEYIQKWIMLKDEYYKEENLIYFVSELIIFSLDLINVIKNEIYDYEFLLKNIYNLC